MNRIIPAKAIGGMLAGLALLQLPTMVLAEAPLLQALAEGGKVIMMRHAQTAEAAPEVAMHLAGDCSLEQNLDATGRQQAEAIGAMLRERGIVVNQVYTSEFCRARDTARLAFGEAEAWAALNLAESMDAADLTFNMVDVEERMGEFDDSGNLVLVTHRSNINHIVFEQTEPGDMVVLQPADGSVEVLGVLRAAEMP